HFHAMFQHGIFAEDIEPTIGEIAAHVPPRYLDVGHMDATTEPARGPDRPPPRPTHHVRIAGQCNQTLATSGEGFLQHHHMWRSPFRPAPRQIAADMVEPLGTLAAKKAREIVDIVAED